MGQVGRGNRQPFAGWSFAKTYRGDVAVKMDIRDYNQEDLSI